MLIYKDGGDILKKFTAIILCVLFVLFSGCSSRPKNADKDFIYNLENAPSSLDPLLCDDEESLTVIRALFDCLTREVDGELMPAAASTWSSNSDYTQFTFTIRDDLYWRSVYAKHDKKTHVTAHDFVFAFQRAVDPATKSPHLSKFLYIENAKEISQGLLSVDNLGVKALNDYTLLINLETSYPNLPKLLSFPAFSPCNKEYFESTTGKYALEAYHMMTNGPFLFSEYYSWEKDSYIKLSRNKEYSKDIGVWPKSLTFLIEGFELKSDDYISLILDGSLHAAKATDTSDIDSNLSVYKQLNTVWGLCFNTKDELMKLTEIRGAFVQTIDRNALISKLPPNTDNADSIIPSQMTFMGEDYRKTVNDTFLPQFDLNSINRAQATLSSIGYEKIPSVSVLCLDDEKTKELVNELIISWNASLGNYFNMKPVSKNELISSVKDGNYQIALCPLSFAGDDAHSLLSVFSSQSSNNASHLNSTVYDALLDKCLYGENPIDACKQAEKYLNDNFIFYPVYNEYSYYVTSPAASGIAFFPYHTGIDFIHATIED